MADLYAMEIGLMYRKLWLMLILREVVVTKERSSSLGRDRRRRDRYHWGEVVATKKRPLEERPLSLESWSSLGRGRYRPLVAGERGRRRIHCC